MKGAHLLAPVAKRLHEEAHTVEVKPIRENNDWIKWDTNPKSPIRLEGKVAIITGGASGISESTVRSFIRYGAKVIIADVQSDLGLSICKDIGSDDLISFVHCDVTKEVDVQNVVDTTITKFGKLDIMFNNEISGNFGSTIVNLDYEEFKKVMDVNVYGALLGAKHATRVMIPAKKGSILFTSSTSSMIAGLAPHAYGISKHGVLGITKNLCVELGQYGIRVNCISPHAVGTPMAIKSLRMGEASEVEEFFCRLSNLEGAVLKAEDVAEAAVYLASDESKYVNGLNLIVDGGCSTTNQLLIKAMKGGNS